MSKYITDDKAETIQILSKVSDAYQRVLALCLSLNTYICGRLQHVRTAFPSTDLSKLKEGDKCDIFDPKPLTWNVATILKVIKLDNINIKLYVYYQGSSGYDQLIVIKYENSTKYQRLPVIIPVDDKNYMKIKHVTNLIYDTYHSEKQIQIRCKAKSIRECKHCKRRCCPDCFIIAACAERKLIYFCKQCTSYSHYQYLFNLTNVVCNSIRRGHQMKINVIQIITNYLFTNVITCKNQISRCANQVSMDYTPNLNFLKNIEYNQIPKMQYLLCNECCLSKQNQSVSSKCKVFHDNIIYCTNGCDSLICSKCDSTKCATDGCRFNYYKCCRKSKTFVDQCEPNEPTDWFSKLKVGDQFDIYDHVVSPPLWTIATVLTINKEFNDIHMNIRFYVRYNGWSSRYDEWITIQYKTSISLQHHKLPIEFKAPVADTYPRQLAPLHVNTPYHSQKEIDTCRWTRTTGSHICVNCQRECCGKCFIVKAYIRQKLVHLCKECASYSHYEYLFNLIKLLFSDSLSSKHLIEINIINLITNYSFSNVITCNNEIYGCCRQIRMDYAANIQNVFNATWTPQTQYILCNQCCKKKQYQKESSKCKVFHDGDLFDCPNSCSSFLCTECDVKKQCATNGCSFNYYDCCIRNKIVKKCEYDGCSNQNLYCKTCVAKTFTISDCSCGKHTDICHACDRACYRFFKHNSSLKRIWKHDAWSNCVHNCVLGSIDIQKSNVIFNDKTYIHKRVVEKEYEVFNSCGVEYDYVTDHRGRNKFISKFIDRKWKNNHNNIKRLLRRNKKVKKRKKKKVRRDLKLFLSQKQYA